MRLSLIEATMPPSPGLVSAIPAADLATSVAVETAIPICAWRKAGASLAPSPHIATYQTCQPHCRGGAGRDREQPETLRLQVSCCGGHLRQWCCKAAHRGISFLHDSHGAALAWIHHG